MTNFVKNAWYVACTRDEIADGPLGRTICDERMVLYRGKESVVAALEDFCPHRGLPLSLGFVRDGHITCGYHGLQLNSDGTCAAMVGQRPGSLRRQIRSYPVVERHGYIWVWPGDVSRADPDAVPNLVWADGPGWAFGGGMYHMRCDYRLLIDNLMDLTHETYVHSTSIGQPEIEEAPPETTIDGDKVVVSRTMENIMPPPFWQDALKGNNIAHDVPVDRWQICRFVPPSSVMIDVGVAHAGQGGIDAETAHRASGIVVDIITPETETSCWYFWGLARNFNVTDTALTDEVRKSQGKIFAEDLEVLESQQRSLLENPGRRLMNLNIDAGGVHARRVIERMASAEAADP